jgi:peptide/nickel transport system permease protein
LVFVFVIRRLLIAIPLIVLASVLVFVLSANAGDPLEDLRARPNSAVALAARTRELNLDKTVVERYVIWAKGAIHGDLGKDSGGREIWPQLKSAMLLTLRLVLIATIISVLLGVGVGVVSAVRQYSGFDYFATFLAFLFFAMPVFWFAILLREFAAIKLNNWLVSPSFSITFDVIAGLLLAAVGWFIGGAGERPIRKRQIYGALIGFAVGALVMLGLNLWVDGNHFSKFLKISGSQTVGMKGPFFFDRLGDYLKYMILPTITLSVVAFATYSRFMRSSMLETLSTDYVRTARAKGISHRRVIFRHAFRTALIPVATQVALDFGVVIGGAIITENIFAWKGMGSLLRNAIIKDIDPNMSMAVLLFTAISIVLFNIIADIAYAYLDPRIRVA